MYGLRIECPVSSMSSIMDLPHDRPDFPAQAMISGSVR
jgi:hypothetical protein